MSEIKAEKLFTKREAAGVLRCSEITIHRLIKSHKLGHFRVASKVFIGERHLKDYLASSEARPGAVA